MNLIKLDIVAGDGTKLRAQNGNNEIYNRSTIDKLSEKIKEKIDEYYNMLEENDNKDDNEIKIDEDKISDLVKKLKNKQIKIEKAKQIFNENEEIKTYFATDNDSRFQRDNGRVNAGYNGQTIVDNENKLIASNDVTNESNDLKQLIPMVEKVEELKKELKKEDETKIIADAGYHSEVNIMATKDKENIEIYISDPKEMKTKEKYGNPDKKKENENGNIFGKEEFIYDKEKNIVVCPEGKELVQANKNPIKKGGNLKNMYKCNCFSSCPQKDKCSKSKRGRHIGYSINYQEMENYNKKMKLKENVDIIKKRKEIVEHPFGTIKRNLGYRYFLMKGLEKVKGEFNLICLTYNFKRILNLFSIKELVEMVNNYA